MTEFTNKHESNMHNLKTDLDLDSVLKKTNEFKVCLDHSFNNMIQPVIRNDINILFDFNMFFDSTNQPFGTNLSNS